jgi:MinD superfamily P-loop ATPase
LISTVSGMDAVLIVTEPSVSALHDLDRVVNVCRRFGPRIMVLINRFDLEPDICHGIEDYCRLEDLAIVGRVPFDIRVIEAVRQGVPVTRLDCEAGKALIPVWQDIGSELI